MEVLNIISTNRALKGIHKKNTVPKSKNIWVKRPGNDEIFTTDYFKIINKKVLVDIKKDEKITREIID